VKHQAENDPLAPFILTSWKTPVSDYPVCQKGKAAICKFRHGRGVYYAEGVRGHLFIRFAAGARQGTKLKIAGETWMADEPQFAWCLESFASRSTGSVLVAGLGLGLVVHYLVRNPAIGEIVVVEIEKDVIELVEPLLPNDQRISVRHGDFYRFMETDRMHRDAVIWDLAVWGGDGLLQLGMAEMLAMPWLAERYYGPRVKLFRHGLDRDPEGEVFVRDNPELIDRARAILGGSPWT
jgi:hypothetical protein